ncbi:unnamed protein product, partial [marine sediment metagenome]
EPVDLNRYPPFPLDIPRFGPIEITRGCPYVCYYCQTPQLAGALVRHRRVEAVSEYVDAMARTGRTDIRFITPNALSYGSEDGKRLNPSAIERLLLSIRSTIGRDGRIFFGSFPSEVRPEHVTEETIGLITEYCNNDNLVIGAQSGSQRMLDSIHRGHTVDDVYRAAHLIQSAGLQANVDFIFGLPGEREEDVSMSIRTIEDLSRIGARAHAHTFMPLPQTPFWECPTGHIDAKTQETLRSLTGRGVVYGDWEKQITLAKRIENYVRA